MLLPAWLFPRFQSARDVPRDVYGNECGGELKALSRQIIGNKRVRVSFRVTKDPTYSVCRVSQCSKSVHDNSLLLPPIVGLAPDFGLFPTASKIDVGSGQARRFPCLPSGVWAGLLGRPLSPKKPEVGRSMLYSPAEGTGLPPQSSRWRASASTMGGRQGRRDMKRPTLSGGLLCGNLFPGLAALG